MRKGCFFPFVVGFFFVAVVLGLDVRVDADFEVDFACDLCGVSVSLGFSVFFTDAFRRDNFTFSAMFPPTRKGDNHSGVPAAGSRFLTVLEELPTRAGELSALSFISDFFFSTFLRIVILVSDLSDLMGTCTFAFDFTSRGDPRLFSFFTGSGGGGGGGFVFDIRATDGLDFRFADGTVNNFDELSCLLNKFLFIFFISKRLFGGESP